MSPEPDETQAMPVITGRTPILERLLRDVEGDLSRLRHHRRYHQDRSPATPIAATEAHDMSLITALEDDFAKVRDEVENFATSKLPAALEDAKKLEGNPVIDALLGATHVPAQALDVVVSMITGLAGLFPKAGETVPAEAPAGAEPEPATVFTAAGPVVAGQA